MYYFIVNPKAQSGRGAVVWKRIRRVMEKKGLPFKALFTEYAGHATELARHAAEQNEEKNPSPSSSHVGGSTPGELPQPPSSRSLALASPGALECSA